MRLEYQISAVGLPQLKRVLRSVEGELNATAKRAQAAVNKVHGPTGRRSTANRAEAARSAQTRANISAETRMRESAERKIAAQRMRTEQRVWNAKERAARQSARWQVQAEQRAMAAARRQAAVAANARGSFARGVGRSAMGAVGGMAAVGGSIAGIAGGIAAVGAIRDQLSVERSASQLANKAFQTPGEKRSREEIRASVIGQSRELGASSGLGAQGIIDALDQFTAISGKLGIGQQMAGFMADLADATGAGIGDVGRTGGQIVQAMSTRGLTDTEAIEETKQILSAMAGQAKVGSIEFADLATQMGKVMSATAAYEGDVGDLATTMGAVAQLAISGAASSPEEAMTAILRMRDDIIQNAERFRQTRVNGKALDVFADEGKTRVKNPIEIIQSVLGATKGDLSKVSNLFGIRAMKAFAPFQTAFTEAGGGEAGQKAAMDLLNGITATTMSGGEIRTSAAFRREDTDKKMAIAVEQFNAVVGEKLLPAVTAAVPKFAQLVPILGDMAAKGAEFATWLADNPMTGIGAIIATKVAADIASAQIGAVAGRGISAALSSLGTGGAAIVVGTLAITAELVRLIASAVSEWQDEGGAAERSRGKWRQEAMDRAADEMQSTGYISAGTLRDLRMARDKSSEALKTDQQLQNTGFFDAAWNSLVTGEGPKFEDVFRSQGSAEQAAKSGRSVDLAKIEAMIAIGERQAASSQRQEALLEQVASNTAANGMGRGSPSRNQPIGNKARL